MSNAARDRFLQMSALAARKPTGEKELKEWNDKVTALMDEAATENLQFYGDKFECGAFDAGIILALIHSGGIDTIPAKFQFCNGYYHSARRYSRKYRRHVIDLTGFKCPHYEAWLLDWKEAINAHYQEEKGRDYIKGEDDPNPEGFTFEKFRPYSTGGEK